MAKQKTINKPEKTVTVKSGAYGTHTRAARGTIKPAMLNNVLAENTKRIKAINLLASEVHNMIKVSAGYFKESMFWQKMLSNMHKATDITVPALLNSIAGTELNSKYSIKRFGSLPVLHVAANSKQLSVTLTNGFAVPFKSPGDCYCYDVIVLFFSGKGKGIAHDYKRSAWLKKGGAAGVVPFEFDIPKDSALYLLCLRLHLGKQLQVIDNLGTQGMCIVKAGSVGY